MEDCVDVDMVKDRVVMEQLIDTLLSTVRVYVQEHKPNSSKEVAELADDYVQARGSGMEQPGEHENRAGHQRLSHSCGKAGHFMKDCPAKAEKPRRNVREIECYNCKKGHYSFNCPQCSLDHQATHVLSVPGSMESLVQDWKNENQYLISF
jgi:hypothetical protein